MAKIQHQAPIYNTRSDRSMAITSDVSFKQGLGQRLGLTLVGIGLLLLLISYTGVSNTNPLPFLVGALLNVSIGTILYAWFYYMPRSKGIKNNGVWFGSLSARGTVGWLFAIVITGFYVLLYFYPTLLGLGQNGAPNTGLVRLFDPLAMAIKGQAASQWFLYGTLYTLAILVMGFKFILKYRHNSYQVIRTLSVMFFQLVLAFLIPEIMEGLNGGASWYDRDLKNMWPLDYDFFHEWHLQNMIADGSMGLAFLVWGIALFLIVSPILTYFYGKRWYCSWVCGCGGLAETAGDPFRHLSDKSLKAWQIERWLIHGVLVFVVVMTIAVLFGIFNNKPDGYWINKTLLAVLTAVLIAGVGVFAWFNKDFLQEVRPRIRNLIVGLGIAIVALVILRLLIGGSNVFFVDNYQLQKWYGFYIGAIFSGVIGVGFYPIMGSRVWCRFGCPMAAILGLQQKFFSRFRITTNGGQCISCGNCSTYCEMGIDVRWYAQRGQNIVRASCVGCGICAAVCPRGVLKLENGPVENRKLVHVRRDEVGIIDRAVF